MATDWPGHAQSNNHVHFQTACDCAQYFTPDQEPPWLYVFPALVTQDSSLKDFLETARYLRARPQDPVCRWEWNNSDDVEVAFKQIFVRPEPVMVGTNWQNVLHVAYSEALVFWEYKLVPDESFPIGEPIPRGYVWTYNLGTWEKIIDTPLPELGPPLGAGNLTPQDCIPGWAWGEPLPDA